MSDLISTYGTDWFNSKFGGTYFSHKGLPARVVQARRSGVDVVLCPRVNNTVKTLKTQLPFSTFQDSKMFSAPELGYRATAGGAWLKFMSRNNGSYVRGVSTRNLKQESTAFSDYMYESFYSSLPRIGENEINNIVMDPSFVPITRGIKLVMEGKLFAFAASPTIAVVPSIDSINSLTILMCQKEVGTVDSKGNIEITAPISANYLKEILCVQ